MDAERVSRYFDETLLLLASAAFLLWWPGCAEPQPRATHTAEPRWMQANPRLLEENVFQMLRPPQFDEVNPGTVPAIALETHFYVWKFRLPAETISMSEHLWDHLDESRLAPSESMLLRRNGIRVAVGKESTWPALRQVLLMHEPSVWHSKPVASDGTPLILELDDLPAGTPLFYFDPQNHLVGARQAGGQMGFRMDPRIDLDRIGALRLHLVPEIREQKPQQARLRQHQMGPMRAPRTHTFDRLAFSLLLAQGEFVVIGPSRASKMPHLIGSRFLKSWENGELHEDIYCVMPRIYQRRISPGIDAGSNAEEVQS